MTSSLFAIFTHVILPILVMVACGAALQRWKPMHMPTLSRLNIYLLVPAFLFTRIYESQISWNHVGLMAIAVLVPMAVLGLPLFWALRLKGVSPGTISLIVVGGLIFNAGNFGIPVARLQFGEPGEQVQAWIVVLSNLSIWCIGYVVISLGQGHGWRGAMGYFKLPMLYVLAAGIAARVGGVELPVWISESVHMLGEAVVPVGLITLGAQLVQRMRWPRWKVIGPVVVVKLVALPALTGLFVWALGIWPWPGGQIVIGVAGPTAINTLLLTVELEGDAEGAADSVFWTTLLSSFAVSLVIFIVVQLGGVPPV